MKGLWLILLGASGLACGAECGDQVIQAPEACDDGNAIDGDSCKNDCSLPTCGNGSFDPGELCFSAPNTFVVDGSFVLAVGDFNADDKSDLASANQTIDEVSVFLGDGTGSLGTENSLPVGDLPSSLLISDFNGDAKQDLIVSNLFSFNMSLFLGDGLGSFGPRTDLDSLGSFNIAVGDFNGDGKQDIAAAQNDSVDILLGDGTGAFSAPTSFQVGNPLLGIVIGDFNGDGKQDIATSKTNDSEVAVLLGDGLGSFAAPALFPVGPVPTGLAAGDFNGDAKQDIVAATGVEGTVSMLLGDGLGSFGPFTEFPTGGFGACAFALADFNGDGALDVAAANQGLDADPSSVGVLLGDGAGSLSAPTNLALGAEVFSVVSADFNGDAHPDLAATSFFDPDSTITIFLSEP